MINIYLPLDREQERRFRQKLNRGKNRKVKKMILTLNGDPLGLGWGAAPTDFAAKLEAVDDLDRLHELMEQSLKVNSLDEIDL